MAPTHRFISPFHLEMLRQSGKHHTEHSGCPHRTNLGEAGVVIPPATFLLDIRKICDDNNVLMIVDEIQLASGERERLSPVNSSVFNLDLYTLGKPSVGVSTRCQQPGVGVASSKSSPRTHGSTFPVETR